MPTAHLHINTNVNRDTSNLKRPNDASAPTLMNLNMAVTRVRSGSTASTSSSISVDSPGPSSSSASSSSLDLPDSEKSSRPLHYPLASPSDETVRVSPSPEFVLALHDFHPQHQNATCLSFRAGQVIHVLNRDSSGWWDGEINGQRGWFPSNYVSADERVISLAEEVLPQSPVCRYQSKQFKLLTTSSRLHQGSRHGHTMSAVSAASWASAPSRGSRKDHRPLVTEALGSDITSYCPPLMVNLLHSLSLLQSAVRSNRIAHFQPSTACIISCVRFILSSTECLPREAPLLKRFPTLAQERKQILSVLASLVSQAKKASDETQDEDLRETEIEGMLKLGGQVFSQVRRFLAVAVQCGIDLPERRQPVTPDEAIANASGLQGQVSPAGPEDRIPASVSPDSVTPSHLSSRLATPRQPHSPDGVLQKTAPRTKSLGDLRLQRRLAAYQDSDSTISPLLPHRTILSRSKKDQYLVFERVAGKHKADMPSISSISSFSSVSSGESPKPPAMPPFPSGPSTSSKVMEALKFTHDQYLSTIAAFIGHAHSHSRSSHASSTGQMYDLVREVVEMVCKLLTIVEAVMRHPEIPLHKIGNLKSAKERLYTVTSSLAESVRLLTVPLPPDLTEESEKASLIRSATAACKAGADCVSAVKICLNRASGERQFIIQIPTTSDSDPAPFTPSKFSRRTGHTPALSLPTHQSLYHNGIDEDDLTVQALTPPSPTPNATSVRDRSSDTSNVTATFCPSDGSHDTQPTTPEGGILSMSDHDLMKSMEPVSSPSPAVDDGRVDERQDRQTMDTFEERLINDEPVTLQVKRDPLGHDSSTNDVVLNNEGHLVAATMEALFERMTPHDSIVDPAFSAVFFLTFRLFSTPLALVEALINRYNIMPPSNLSEDEMSIWQQHKGIPIRLRVSNFVKTWLEMYWRSEIDDIALSHLSSFTKDALLHYFPAPSHRILDLISMRQDSNTSLVSPKSERVRDPGMSINPPSYTLSEVPRPTMTKALLATLRGKNFDTVAITDFDALELARQLTIMECDLYCAIQPEEVLETGQEGTKPPINVRAVSSLSTVITGWVAENILDEHDIKKRTLLVKFFIKVADVSEYEIVSILPTDCCLSAMYFIAQLQYSSVHPSGPRLFHDISASSDLASKHRSYSHHCVVHSNFSGCST